MDAAIPIFRRVCEKRLSADTNKLHCIFSSSSSTQTLSLSLDKFRTGLSQRIVTFLIDSTALYKDSRMILFGTKKPNADKSSWALSKLSE